MSIDKKFNKLTTDVSKLKTKNKLHENIISDLIREVELLNSRVLELEARQKPYSGAIKMIVTIEENTYSYYMVTDLIINEDFLDFYHLVSEDDRSLNIETFPEKSPEDSMIVHMKKAYKESRWTVVKEKLFLNICDHISLIGEFSYIKPIKKNNYPYKYVKRKDSVVVLKTEG